MSEATTEVTLTAEELAKAQRLFADVCSTFHTIWVALETVYACDDEVSVVDKFTNPAELREMVIAHGLKAASEPAVSTKAE